MVDRSTLTFEENAREVAEIVKIAHAVGVSVEAELGHDGIFFGTVFCKQLQSGTDRGIF